MGDIREHVIACPAVCSASSCAPFTVAAQTQATTTARTTIATVRALRGEQRQQEQQQLLQQPSVASTSHLPAAASKQQQQPTSNQDHEALRLLQARRPYPGQWLPGSLRLGPQRGGGQRAVQWCRSQGRITQHVRGHVCQAGEWQPPQKMIVRATFKQKKIYMRTTRGSTAIARTSR